MIVKFRKKTTKPCIKCGKIFKAYTTAKYCSNRCRQVAKRERAKSLAVISEMKGIYRFEDESLKDFRARVIDAMTGDK